MNKLVLFDFDGTLTKKDSFPLFIKYCTSNLTYFWGFSLHIIPIIAYKLGFLSGEKLKQKILSWFFKGIDETFLKKKGEEFIEYLFIKKLLNENIIQNLESEINAGNTVCVVSASPEIWIYPFCKKMKIDCICTEMKFVSGKFTGELASQNCTGIEKARRVQEKYKLDLFEEIQAYGNSKDDFEMLAIANKKFMVNKDGNIILA